MNSPHRIDFRASTQHVPPSIPTAVQRATTRLLASRAAAVAAIPEWESLRQAAHDMRLHGILHLDEYIAQVERAVHAVSGHVHHARDAAEANAIVIELAQRYRVKTVVKGKSVATEEIGLNRALEQAGVRPVETDVGEFIIQLAGEFPSHILGPTLHMSKEDIAALFVEKLGEDAPADPRRLTDIVRTRLRPEFLRAEMGVTGANFIVAETGTVVLLTNEGNGRLCTTLPDIHVVVAGIDKIIPDWNSLAVLLRLLARNATGQKMACHTSFLTGPRPTEGENGPREFHLVLLDNGRSRIRQDPVARETLLCIRCAACLNVCPVYNQVGGHAYGWVYSGAIGAILSPQLLGMQVARDLPFASTLCGACVDICPVKIPIPEILLHLRRRVLEGDEVEPVTASRSVRIGARVTARALSAPWLYRLGTRLLETAQVPFRRGDWLPALPPPLRRWTQVRPLPVFGARFRRDFQSRSKPPEGDVADATSVSARTPQYTSAPPPTLIANPRAELAHGEMDACLNEINRLSGKARRVRRAEIESALAELVKEERIQRAVLWATPSLSEMGLAETLCALGVEVVPASAGKELLAETDLGVTEVDFAIPESGSLGFLSSPTKPRAVSILPRVHLAILQPAALRADLGQIFAETRKERYIVFTTGVSRTSDIESNPVLGVHGPQALYVWAFE